MEPQSSKDAGAVEVDRELMGTSNRVVLFGSERRRLLELAEEAFLMAESLESELSRFLPGSEVSRVNARAHFESVKVSPALLDILIAAQDAWERTGGVFDPTIVPLMRVWGFWDGEPRQPTAAEIEAARSLCGMEKVDVDPENGAVRFLRRGMEIDLGGLGKGYIVEQMAMLLESEGIESGAVISGRSTIRVWGTPPGSSAWEVAIVHPREPDRVWRELEVEAGAVSTSGAYGHRAGEGGRPWEHILDPRTGEPARPVLSATALTRRALEGDVLSTSLFIAGLPEARGIIQEFPRTRAILLYDGPDGSLESEELASG